MSIVTAFCLIVGFLVFLLIVIGLLAFIDWRTIIVRRYGSNYKKGLAHILYDGVWVYRESVLIFEGDDAMTYSREAVIDGQKVFVNDIIPNSIGFAYDEYTGARLYRVRPGGTIGYSDTGNAPAVDYPSELVSCHVLDRTVSNYASSVNAEAGGFNWKLLFYGAIAGVLLAGLLFFSGIVKPPSAGNIPGSPAQSAPAQAPTITPSGGN